MKRLFATLAVLLMATDPAWAAQQSIADLMAEGLAFRDSENFPNAEESFRKVLQQDPDNTDAMILLALILGYQQHYDAGKQVIEKGLSTHPDLAGLLITKARLLAWSKDLEGAKSIVAQVLAKEPENQAAIELAQWIDGLEEPETASNTAVFFTMARSHFQRRRVKNWYEGILGLSHNVTDSLILDGSIRHSRRYHLVDKALDLGATYKPTKGSAIGLRAEWTPAADFLPQWGYTASGLVTTWDGMKSGWIGPTQLGLKLRHRHYKETKVTNLDPSLVQYFADGLVWLTLSSLQSWESTSDGKQAGWMTRLDVDFAPWVPAQWYLLRANSPETDLGVTVKTDTWATGVVTPVTDSTDVRVDYTRDDRQGSYLRHKISLGFRYRF